MKNKIKIGIILNSLNCQWYIFDFVKWALNQNFIEIVEIYVVDSKKKNNKYNILDRIFFKIINVIEKFFLIRKSDKFKKYLVTYDLSKLNISCFKIKGDYKSEFSDSDISLIKGKNLDFLVRGCSNILRGAIHSATKNGILSFHHGDNRKYRGLPSSFWEVYNKDDQTGFTLQILDNELDNGFVLCRGNFPTQSYYLLNQKTLYERSSFYLKNFFYKFYNHKIIEKKKEKKNISKIYKFPKFYHSLFYMLKIVYRKLFNLIYKNLIVHNWTVLYSNSDYKNLDEYNFSYIKNTKGTFFADPFFVEHDNKKYIFGEEYNHKSKKGYIVAYVIENEVSKKIGIALEENFHLSFPYIFSYKENYYMIPETKEINEIRIYKCENFPLNWKFHSTIKKDILAVDNMIFEHENLWWLFTNFSPIKNSPESELNLFFSKTGPLTNEWQEHKLNPVLINSFSARNAGIIFNGNDKFRCGHVINDYYKGKRTKIFKIKELNQDQYEEEEIFELSANNFKGAFSTHHLYSNNNFTVIDICKKKFKFFV